MRAQYLGGLLVYGGLIAFAAFGGCSSGATLKRNPTGAAGSSSGAAGTDTSGAAGSSSGAAGTDTSGAAGTDTSGGAGSTPDASAAGSTGAAGTDTSGAAGAAVDNSPTIGLPIAITDYWYPSGWDGDAYTVQTFTATPLNVIVIVDQATDGPCAARVAGALGHCVKVTYMPAIPEAGAAGYASVSLLNNEPGGGTNYTDLMNAPRPAQGATMVTAEVAGAVGGEAVNFDLGAGGNTSFSPTLTKTWQQLTVPLTGVVYDHVQTPFGWYSASATPVTFYYDDLRFE